jgi:hypothetical protein
VQGSDLIVLTFQGAKPGKGNVVVSVTGDVTDPSATNNEGAISIDFPSLGPSTRH